MTVDVVPVALGSRSYEVRIGRGLIGRAGAEIAPLLHRRRVAIVTDETLAVVRHRREHAVAHRMALRVVDLLEAVEVNEQHGGLPALLARSVQKPLGQIHAMGAVGQAGQGVKERQLFHALLGAQQIAGELLALAQVGDEPVALRNIAVDGDAHVQEHHLDERLHGGGGARIAQAGQAIEPR